MCICVRTCVCDARVPSVVKPRCESNVPPYWCMSPSSVAQPHLRMMMGAASPATAVIAAGVVVVGQHQSWRQLPSVPQDVLHALAEPAENADADSATAASAEAEEKVGEQQPDAPFAGPIRQKRKLDANPAGSDAAVASRRRQGRDQSHSGEHRDERAPQLAADAQAQLFAVIGRTGSVSCGAEAGVGGSGGDGKGGGGEGRRGGGAGGLGRGASSRGGKQPPAAIQTADPACARCGAHALVVTARLGQLTCRGCGNVATRRVVMPETNLAGVDADGRSTQTHSVPGNAMIEGLFEFEYARAVASSTKGRKVAEKTVLRRLQQQYQLLVCTCEKANLQGVILQPATELYALALAGRRRRSTGAGVGPGGIGAGGGQIRGGDASTGSGSGGGAVESGTQSRHRSDSHSDGDFVNSTSSSSGGGDGAGEARPDDGKEHGAVDGDSERGRLSTLRQSMHRSPKEATAAVVWLTCRLNRAHCRSLKFICARNGVSDVRRAREIFKQLTAALGVRSKGFRVIDFIQQYGGLLRLPVAAVRFAETLYSRLARRHGSTGGDDSPHDPTAVEMVPANPDDDAAAGAGATASADAVTGASVAQRQHPSWAPPTTAAGYVWFASQCCAPAATHDDPLRAIPLTSPTNRRNRNALTPPRRSSEDDERQGCILTAAAVERETYVRATLISDVSRYLNEEARAAFSLNEWVALGGKGISLQHLARNQSRPRSSY